MTPESRRFRFVQFEFPWALGPEPGRYPIRERLGEPPAYVLVLAELGARERRRLLAGRGRRRSRGVEAAPEPEPEPVLTTRVTLIDAAALDGYEAAAAWLADADLDALAGEALARCNRVLHAHRVAAADPYAREVARAQALVVRAGFGNGERVADGRWDRARELPRGPRARRCARAPPPCARRSGWRRCSPAATPCWPARTSRCASGSMSRPRAGARPRSGCGRRSTPRSPSWTRGARCPACRAASRSCARGATAVDALAAAALQGGLDDGQIELVQTVLGRIEAALRARTAGGV